MSRAIAAVSVLFLAAGLVRSQDAPTESVITAVKRATVFIQVQGTDWKGSGSGFVVKATKDTAYIATNYHVLSGPHYGRKTRPGEADRIAKTAKINLVFDSGAKTERTLKAEAIAVDPEADLAIVRVTGLTDAPAPINPMSTPKLFETMPVYSFGFPFGKALGVDQASPAVTVGKASISSLRNGADGELAVVQIDGNLNPGNSGGPIVDVKGQLVGVAVATIRDGQGIGLAVPAAELSKVLAGRLGQPFLTTTSAEGKVRVKAEVGVIDPLSAIHEVTLHYVLVEPKGKKPGKSELLDKFEGTKQMTLKVERGVAAGELVLDKPVGELFVQATPNGGAAKQAIVKRSLDLTGAAILAGGKPPAGWKDFVVKDNSFSVWIPERARRQSERDRTITVRGLRLRTNSLSVEMANGTFYLADQLTLPAGLSTKLKREDLEEGFRDWLAADLDGKVTEEKEVLLGTALGREYRIDARRPARVRLFVADGARVFILQVVGGVGNVVDGDEAITFLASCRLSPAVVRKDPPVGPGPAIPPGPPQPPAAITAGVKPRMLGFGIGPEFRELGPEGGMLIGFELGLRKEHGRDAVRSARAIYRVGDNEVFGDKRGNVPGALKSLKAKTGYAIGAISVKSAIVIEGFAVTFMKVKDGRLDPTDAYESEWFGDNPATRQANKLEGGGSPIVGLVGRADENNLIAIGAVFKGQEKGMGPVPPPGTKPTQIQGGAFDPEFLEVGPDGSLLVGLEIGLGKFFDNDVIRAVRPVFRKDSKDELGTQRGTELDRVVKAIAKPGYAIGAITVKAGLTGDGLSITFMKVKDGRLDQTDTYESEWIGGMGGGGPVMLGGDGSPVVGIVGKANAKDCTGIGLLLRK
jgi:S1-C subfamily serine protease